MAKGYKVNVWERALEDVRRESTPDKVINISPFMLDRANGQLEAEKEREKQKTKGVAR